MDYSSLAINENKSKAIVLYREKEDIQDVPHEMRNFVEGYLERNDKEFKAIALYREREDIQDVPH